MKKNMASGHATKPASILVVLATVILAASGASAAEPRDYQINYSVMECLDVTENDPPGDFRYWGYENPNPRTPTYIFCPLSYIREFQVGDSLPTVYDPSERPDPQSSGYGFFVEVRVIDNQSDSEVWCAVFGSDGEENVNGRFNWWYTDVDETTGTPGAFTLDWDEYPLWDSFENLGVEYMFLACGVGKAGDGLPGNQVIGYTLRYEAYVPQP